MESNILVAVFLPMALGVIMLGMGLSLRLSDFQRIFVYPKAIGVGLFCQMILLPIVAYGLIKLMGLSTEMAVGIMILAACPGGATSNMISHLAKGDTALSISLTAFSSLLAVFSIPLIVNFAIVDFMPGGQAQQLNVLKTILAVLVITIIPVAIGMLINAKKPEFSKRMEKPVKIISAVFLFLIIGAACLKEKEYLASMFAQAGPVAMMLNIFMLLIAYFGAKATGLDKKQSVTISIESGIQNGTLGITVAATLIGNSQMTIPPSIYGILMFATAGVIIYQGSRQKSGAVSPA